MLNKLWKGAKDAAQDLKTSALQFKNKKFMNAMAAGSVLIARADGDISSQEKSKMMRMIGSNEALSVFDTEAVIKVFNEYLGYFEFDADVGQTKAYEALNTIRGDDVQCRTLMRMIIAIAESDGDFDSSEKMIAKKIAVEIGVAAGDFDL
ncbi:tellurite resistance TerB family protein [Shewanella sp. VB17]|uniref:tellurite resistance TerB family protein n=1 Tax=Shewanella sp. VB17 TaxID=2739432 RepID=UPI00156507BA|nr:TerB family tellurite resistance protein [Shewanella sp. VB17]NRD72870.1 tellurite resistance TerB family protein [Shewanella sp. VB17]